VEQLVTAARRLFHALGCRDLARLDFRVTQDLRLYFIEANPLPGLSPSYSDLPVMGALVDWDYPRIIRSVLNSALQRQGLGTHQNAYSAVV
jgi:D-alanine-D-alanine ligase